MESCVVDQLKAEDLNIGDIISLRHGTHWYSGKDFFSIGFMEAGTKLKVIKVTYDEVTNSYHIKAKFLKPWFNLDNLEEMNLSESSLDFFEKVS